ncbi:helix-turn-helix transcriptional regulator [Legionella worsleiensis]|uniref:Prophage CP4-57 regulatory protein (AlpA) n=1 Tax=Legionella worsleiensis TaxID=45076 RepID=A0A0W1A3I1_9GAMM|nr:AlpA family phage regulatory protein [Legionella worsleiensis]KTD75918.1 Prophage CP4-57 regulatory protein (AlpA) [Legionella worsleiensis]STY32931.1 Predicted transcriptional regulator [Legionella worsleiensis]
MNELPILLYPNQAQKLLGIGTTKFYELVKLPDFPKPRNLFGGKRSVYLRNEIEEWATNLAKTEVKQGNGGRYGRTPKDDTQPIATQNC